MAHKQLGHAILSVTAQEFQKMAHVLLSAAPKQWLTVQLGCQTGGPAKSFRFPKIGAENFRKRKTIKKTGQKSRYKRFVPNKMINGKLLSCLLIASFQGWNM